MSYANTVSNQSRTPFPLATFLVVSMALFMVTLDNLVVTTVLPVIRVELGASLESLEWTVNAYTLAFAVFLLTGAALGDRFGRRRMFTVGVAIFAVASALAAVAPDAGSLVAARALQGFGAAIVTPLSLTLLSDAVPEGKRGLAIGAWSGVAGLGVALGPLVGGAIAEGISWQWVFWVNVPIGLVLVPSRCASSTRADGPNAHLDLRGLVLAGGGLMALVVRHRPRQRARAGRARPCSPRSRPASSCSPRSCSGSGARREPMLPLRFFRSRSFSATNAVSFAMFFGIFGSIFLLTQFFQTVQGRSPLESGLLTLPWTAMPMVVAPIAGVLSDRIGGRPADGARPRAAGDRRRVADDRLRGRHARTRRSCPPSCSAVPGMGLVFAPSAERRPQLRAPEEAGQASGATNTIRELGGVMGIAVLASVFSSAGGYLSPQDYVDGMTAALPVGAGVLAAGAVAALLIPGKRRERRAERAGRARGRTPLPDGRARLRPASHGAGRSRLPDRRRSSRPSLRCASGEQVRVEEPRRDPRGARPAQRDSARSPANAILLNPVDHEPDRLGRALGPARSRRRARADKARADPVRRIGVRIEDELAEAVATRGSRSSSRWSFRAVPGEDER